MKKLPLTLLFTLLLSACASSPYGTPSSDAPPADTMPDDVAPVDPPPAVPQEEQQQAFNLTSTNFSFSPSSLTVAKGSKLVLSIQNSGLHTFTIDALGINERLASGINTVTFSVNQPGTYEYYCAIPGHRDRGMVGALQVQ